MANNIKKTISNVLVQFPYLEYINLKEKKSDQLVHIIQC